VGIFCFAFWLEVELEYMILKLGYKLSKIHDKLRFSKDKKFIPLVNVLPKWLSPNHITIIRSIVLLIWLPFAIFRPSIAQIFVFMVIYFMDLLDGAVARLKNQTTYFGGFFDHLSDKFSNIAVLIVLFGVTDYRFAIFEFFIWWDMATSLLLAIECFSGNKKISYFRTPFEFVVKIILWLVLIYTIGPILF